MNTTSSKHDQQPGAVVRAEAVNIVSSVMREGASLKSILNQVLPNVPDVRDRALLEAMCFHALRHYRRYEFVLNQWLEKPLRTADYKLQNVMIIGLAQLDAMKLAEHAAVSATVDAGRLHGLDSRAGLVNAILRKATREALPVSDDMAVRHSIPDWLYRQLQRDWPDQLSNIMQGSNLEAPLALSCDPTQRNDVLNNFRENNIECRAPDFPPSAIELNQSAPPHELPGYAQGAWHVQDASAQCCVFGLDIKPGQRVLDACAAPGGKTLQILHALQGKGACVAMDVSTSRVRKLQQNISRSNAMMPPLQLLTANAVNTQQWWDGQHFDRILLDAPCSATGVLRRQPDAKWNRRESDLAALSATQQSLLNALWPTLAVGGRLLYSTCSILKQENQDQIHAFLQQQSNARLIALDNRFGIDTGHGHQRFAGEQNMDGFFYALIEKTT
jgi:16S rRNA (cytosine967-C5)-methyltransferase